MTWSSRVVGGRRSRAAAIGLMLLLVQSGWIEAAAADGTIDNTFNGVGTRTTPIGSFADTAGAIALQPDGKIVAAGTYTISDLNSDFAVVRYTTDGGLDTTFDGDGKVTTPIGASYDGANAVALQPDGKIVAAGYAYNASYPDLALARYNSDGSLDTSFGTNGKVTTAIGSTYDQANAVVIQPDGKIVAAGYTAQPVTGADFALVRYNSDGTLDTTFGTNGTVTTIIGPDDDFVNGIVLAPDGDIVVAGKASNGSNNDFALARYELDGSLDTTFDGDGMLTAVVGSGDDFASSVVITPDGDIVAAGQAFNGTNDDFALVRTSPNGTLDTSFDGDGKVMTAIGSSSDFARAAAVQPDGRIVAAGAAAISGKYDVALARYRPDGTLDVTFHTDGKATTPVGANDDIANAMAIQPDGKIVVAGAAHDGSYNDFAVARFIGDSTAPYGARMIGVPRYSLALTRTLAWTASDDNTGIDSFRVRRRSASYNSSTYGSWDVVKGATAYPYGSFKGLPGRTFCYQVRGRDLAGNVGAYSPSSCVGFPVDDRTLNVHGSWANGTGSAYYRGTFRSSTDGGAYLSLPVDYRYLAVVVTKCSGCGKLKVFLGSTLLRTIDTSASSTRRKVVIAVSSSYLVRSGTLKLVQASGGKKVIVDGVAVNLGS